MAAHGPAGSAQTSPGLKGAFSRIEAPERGLSDSEQETVDRVRGWVAPALAKLKNIPAVEVVYDQMQIPDIARRMRALSVAFADGNARSGKDLTGFTDRPIEGAYIDGKIWLVAGSLQTKARANAVFAHEAVGHLAVESMLDAADPKLMPRLVVSGDAKHVFHIAPRLPVIVEFMHLLRIAQIGALP